MKTGIICADGIGDAIILSILAHQASSYSSVTLFHPKAAFLSTLFPFFDIQTLPTLETLQAYDELILQNDHSEKAFHLHSARKKGLLSHLKILFPTESKMEKMEGDFNCDPKESFTNEVKKARSFFFPSKPLSPLFQISSTSYRKEEKKVAIHPLSADPKRNWPKKKYLSLADALKKKGYTPVFIMSEKERETFGEIPFEIFSSLDLNDFAKKISSCGFFIGNDSAFGHLASCCRIPTLTISGNKKRVKRWRPDFFIGEVVYPLLPLPNFKGIQTKFFDGRVRDNYWQNFLSVSKVVKRFHNLVKNFEKLKEDS